MCLIQNWMSLREFFSSSTFGIVIDVQSAPFQILQNHLGLHKPVQMQKMCSIS